jgi:predicted dehydrogenase
MDRVRIGVLGTGAIVREFHLPALLQNPRAEVVAGGNLHAASLESLASEHAIKKTYTDLDQMAEDSGIDAVVNALPNYLHAPITIKMLHAGKHVLCEKPMAMTVAEAQAMVQAADVAGRKLMIAHPWRASQAYRWLRGVVEAGALGTVFKVRAHAVLARGGPLPSSWFVRPELAGGGALADIGVHSIDTIAYVFGDRPRPVKVFARTATHFQPIAVEDTATAIVEYDDGMTAVIEAGWHHAFATSPHGAMELFGTQGYARTFPAEVRHAPEGVWQSDWPAAAMPTSHIDMEMYSAQINYFLDCVVHDAPPLCDGRRGLMDMRVLEAAYQSARSGESVSV